MTSDPMYYEALEQLREWLAHAESTKLNEPTAMSLATADPRGRPSVRIVLLRGLDETGLVFYTNSLSRKGEQMTANPWAALAFYWDELGRQIRVEGRVDTIATEESDAYFRTRHPLSQIGAWASLQSEKLDKRMTLEQRVAEFTQRFQGQEVPRPEHWHGYRVVPDRIEFWQNREGRLHDRTLFKRSKDGWTRCLLYP